MQVTLCAAAQGGESGNCGSVSYSISPLRAAHVRAVDVTMDRIRNQPDNLGQHIKNADDTDKEIDDRPRHDRNLIDFFRWILLGRKAV